MSYLCFPSAPLYFLDVEENMGKIECYDFVCFRKHFRILGLPPLDVFRRVRLVPLISNACNVLGFFFFKDMTHHMS